MRVVVRKYGGSSLATVPDVLRVARSVADARRSGLAPVVVVSARGDTTDDLLRLAGQAGSALPSRELDQLLATGEIASAAVLGIALRGLGVDAVSLTAAQAGIRASGRPGAGIITDLDTAPVLRRLEAGRVVVVAGFQGMTPDGEVRTLGRGGSDTTAVALTGRLAAGRCEIYTDVSGVYTADPRVVPHARVLPAVHCGVMAELAFAGARVLHSRAVELAALLAVPIIVRSSFTGGAGTEIHGWGGEEMLEDRGTVIAVTHDLDVARVLVRCDSGHPDLATVVLQTLADHSVPADLVARSGPHEDEFRMGFTIRRSDVAIIREPLREIAERRGGETRIDEGVGKISLVGVGLLNRPDYTARMLAALSGNGIGTSWISTSQVRASAIVPLERVLDAVTLLHNVFELGSEDVPAGTEVHA